MDKGFSFIEESNNKVFFSVKRKPLAKRVVQKRVPVI